MDKGSTIISILMAVIFIGVISGLVSTKTLPQGNDETGLTLINNTWVSLEKSPLEANSEQIKNTTYTLVRNKDYIMDTTGGRVNCTNCSASTPGFNITYGYYASDYVTENSTRNIITMVALAWAVFILWLLFMVAMYRKN